MKPVHILVLSGLATMLSGCAVDRAAQAAFSAKGYSVRGKDPFRFEVDPRESHVSGS